MMHGAYNVKYIKGHNYIMEFDTSTWGAVQILTLRIVKRDIDGRYNHVSGTISKQSWYILKMYSDVHCKDGGNPRKICYQDQWIPDGFPALLTIATALKPWTLFSNGISEGSNKCCSIANGSSAGQNARFKNSSSRLSATCCPFQFTGIHNTTEYCTVGSSVKIIILLPCFIFWAKLL